MSVVARRSYRSFPPRPASAGNPPRNPAVLLPIGKCERRSGASAFPSAQAGRDGSVLRHLFLFAVVALRLLQGFARASAAPRILSRPEKPRFHGKLRAFPPAIFDEHASHVDARAAVSLRGAQRRDQYDRSEPPLDARAGTLATRGITSGCVVSAAGRRRERLGKPRQRARGALAPRIRSRRSDAAAGASGLGNGCQTRARSARILAARGARAGAVGRSCGARL